MIKLKLNIYFDICSVKWEKWENVKKNHFNDNLIVFKYV